MDGNHGTTDEANGRAKHVRRIHADKVDAVTYVLPILFLATGLYSDIWRGEGKKKHCSCKLVFSFD